MARNRELSQFASIILVDDSTSNIAISTNFSYVGVGSITPQTNLDVVGNAKFTGIVTAQSFLGDGSQLTGISASGGVYIQDEGTLVGTAITTLNIVGARISASASIGIATITVDIDNFPYGDYGDLLTQTTDAFGVPLSRSFDCGTQPAQSLNTIDLTVLT